MSQGPDVVEPEDPRLRVAEAALERAGKAFEHKRIQRQAIPHDRCKAICGEGLSSLQSLRYAYADPDTLRAMDAFQALVDVPARVREALGGPDWHEAVSETPAGIATVRWSLATLEGLPDRLDLPGTEPEVGIDARVGGVVTARDHPEADLQLLRVAAGRGFDVVTNDLTVGADESVGLALLPPSEVGGHVSEGMLLGVPGEGVLTGLEADERGRPDVPDAAWSETRNVLEQVLS